MDFNILLLVFVAVVLVFCIGPMLMMLRRRSGKRRSQATKDSVTPPDADQR